MSGVVRLDSPTSGGGEEAIVGNDGIMLGVTRGSGSALDCACSSTAVGAIVRVGSSFASSSPNRTRARSRSRRVLDDISLSSEVEIGAVVVSRGVLCCPLMLSTMELSKALAFEDCSSDRYGDGEAGDCTDVGGCTEAGGCT